MAGWSEQDVELGEVKLHLMRGGRGRPVLVLHHDIGTLDQLAFYDALAEKFDVIVPNHPGFGVPERPQWLRHPRDIAALYQWLLADLGVESASLVGLGYGGAIAAGWRWSARWASSRPRAISSTRQSSATSTTPAPGFTTKPPSRAIMAMSRPTSSSPGICAAR